MWKPLLQGGGSTQQQLDVKSAVELVEFFSLSQRQEDGNEQKLIFSILPQQQRKMKRPRLKRQTERCWEKGREALRSLAASRQWYLMAGSVARAGGSSSQSSETTE